MRLLAIIVVLILAGCLSSPPIFPSEGVMVTGKLVALQPANFGCGGITVASTGTYRIVSGPAYLLRKDIRVLIPCIELPRTRWSSGAGDLETFVVGDTHHLWLTQEPEDGLDVPQQLPDGWLYVRGASKYPLRPNNSFKPSPLRGLGAGAKIVPTPRPLSGPA